MKFETISINQLENEPLHIVILTLIASGYDISMTSWFDEIYPFDGVCVVLRKCNLYSKARSRWEDLSTYEDQLKHVILVLLEQLEKESSRKKQTL